MVDEVVLEFARAQQAGDPFAFRFEPQSYLLRTEGGGFESSELPWTASLLADLAALQKPGLDRVIVQRVGELLRRFVAPIDMAQIESRCVAASRAGKQVILTIRSAAAELYALPWELLTDKGSGQHLGALPSVLIRYEWPQTHTAAESPSPRPEGGRILFAWSATGGAVPANEQVQAIRSACASGFLPFDEDHDVLPNVSCERLVATLEAAKAKGQPISVLHLLCHGGASGSTFGLLLNGNSDGESVVVDAGTLRQLLAPFADMVRLVVLSACDSGNVGPLGNQLGSVAQALHRAGFCSVTASRYPLAVAASIKLTETLYRGLVAENQSLEQALLAVRNRLFRDPSQLDWATLQLYARSENGVDSRPLIFRPYRGLLAFHPQHSRFFFGRDREIAEIKSALSKLDRAQLPRFLIVAGASGSGKSSVVLAGAMPQLVAEAGDRLQSVVIRPGSDPIRTLEAALPKETPPSRARGVLLVVDQLEEIFTHVTDSAVRTDFVKRLWRLAQQSGVQIICTLRVDFIGECGDVVVDEKGLRLDRVAYDDRHRSFIAQLDGEQLRAIIEGPAQRVGLQLEAGLTSRMVEAIGAEPGALPLLEHTLDLLWLRRSGRMLTQAGYDALGQLSGALSQHAEALLLRLSEEEQRSAQRLMVRLVNPGDGVVRATRQRVPTDRLQPSGAEARARFVKVLREATDARLLVCAGEAQHETVEVAHEALIRSWPRLHTWLQKDRVMLAELSSLESLLAQWRAHKALLTGEQLRFVERLARDYPETFPEEARTLLADSQKEAHKIFLLKRIGLFVVLATTVIFASLFYFEQRASRQAELARTQLVSLLSKTSRNPSATELLRTLARLRLELELRPDLALETVAQALRTEPHNGALLTDQAEYFLASGDLSAATVAAHASLQTESDPVLRVYGALWGWTAARLRMQTEDQRVWGERLLTEYSKLPSTASVEARPAMTQLMIMAQRRLTQSLPLTDVLATFAILSGPNTPTKVQDLRKRLLP